MNKMKFFTLFALSLLLFIGYRTYIQYNDLKNTEKLIILNESQSLAKFVSAFRQTYQDAFITNHIPIDDKTIKLLPVKTISEISKRFSENVNGDVVVRTVSDRPRNSKNMANHFELNEIQYFKENPDVSENFMQVEEIFYYTKPMYIKESCLKCHGKREDAIVSIRQNYTTAYDYKLGDIRGLLNIEVKKRGIFKKLHADFVENFVGTLLLYMVFLLIIYLLIKNMRNKEEKYTHELENEIEDKTKEIQKQKDTFETLFEKSSDGISILYDGKLIQCNEKIVEMLKYKTKKQLLNVHPSALSPKYQLDGRLSHEKAEEMIAITYEKGWHQFEWVHTRADGEAFLVELTLTTIVLDNKNVIHAVWRDISDKKEAEIALLEQKNMLAYQAHHDALTGLPNRALFQERLKNAVKHANRYYTNMALFFIDLDHFKQINDSLGHHVGDKLLIEVSKRFKSQIREDDTLSRLGGDEFTIIMENLDKVQNASILAEKIQQVLAKAIDIDGHAFYITCSIGISVYPQDSHDTDNLLKYADIAMYKAKEHGRNNIQFYSAEMTELAIERFEMQIDLRKALKNNEFVLCYQPQIDVKSGDLVGVEALIRWDHPRKGHILPEEFIDIAIDTGLIVEIDIWVRKTAMNQVLRWYKQGYKPGSLSLNLSMRQLRSDDFVIELLKTMHALSFNPQWLELEITESHVMEKAEDSIIKLQDISDMGIHIAIDDFGTGYSSLAYLKRLPVNKVKIDQSFISSIPEDKEDLAIVKAIIALSRSLGLMIIAEGVETEEQRDILYEYGCEYIQGYYYSQPVNAEEIEKKYFNKK